MFISEETFAQLHQEFMLEHKAKLKMITDNNKLYRVLQEIKEIAEADVHIVGDEKFYYDSIEKILQVITKAEEE